MNNIQTIQVRSVGLQYLYEDDSVKEWSKFSSLFFKTLQSEAENVPFFVIVERVDDTIHWKTYLDIRQDDKSEVAGAPILVSDVHTNFFFHDVYSKSPDGAEMLASHGPSKRLKLAYDAFKLNAQNPGVVEIIQNALDLNTKAAEVVSESEAKRWHDYLNNMVVKGE